MTEARRPLVHTPAARVTPNTAQSGGMKRYGAISGDLSGSESLFMGETHMAPGMVSENHHHGLSETAIYIVAGNPVFVYLAGGEEIEVATAPGDYVYVPPFTPHREENPGAADAVVVIARSTDESIVVNLTALSDAVVTTGGVGSERAGDQPANPQNKEQR